MKIALVGNQNCGKSTFFNLLTNQKQKVGNWSGVTLKTKEGLLHSKAKESNKDFLFVDTAGVYSLKSYTEEEKSTIDFLQAKNYDVIVNVVDASILERSLYLTTQLILLNKKMIVVLNMWDSLAKKHIFVDEKKLSAFLGVQICCVSASKNMGIDDFLKLLPLAKQPKDCAKFDFSHLKNYEDIASARYKLIESATNICQKRHNFLSKSEKIDKVLLNKYLAFPIFAIIMFAIYFLSAKVVDLFQFLPTFVDNFSAFCENFLSKIGAFEWLTSLICNGIIVGIGSIVCFLPQACILFLLLAILELCGYLSRVAYIFDRFFCFFGLSGKSILPFIIGTSCSVPAIMSTKTIEQKAEKLQTAILTPFVPCSAKLPLIALFGGYFFPKYSALVSFSVYFLAIIIILISALIFKTLIYRHNDTTFVCDLPDYQLPSPKNVFGDVAQKLLDFVKKAGSIILLCSVLLWFLMSFSPTFKYGISIEKSILAYVGKSLSWLFFPMLGKLSWQTTVSALCGLVAKEQVVSCMAIISHSTSATAIFSSSAFGFFGMANGYAFVLFNMFSVPCMASVGAISKELKNTKMLAFALLFHTMTAFLVSFFAYATISLIIKL